MNDIGNVKKSLNISQSKRKIYIFCAFEFLLLQDIWPISVSNIVQKKIII